MTSYELRATSYELRATSYEQKIKLVAHCPALIFFCEFFPKVKIVFGSLQKPLLGSPFGYPYLMLRANGECRFSSLHATRSRLCFCVPVPSTLINSRGTENTEDNEIWYCPSSVLHDHAEQSKGKYGHPCMLLAGIQ